MPEEEQGTAPAVSWVSARTGKADIAIRVDAVVQAVPILADSPRLPRRAGAVCCVIRYREAVVPVIDLGRWVDTGTASTEASEQQRALILRAGDRVVAIAVDQIRGVVSMPASAVQKLCHDDGPEEVFSSVVPCPDSDGLLGILDVERLMQLSASWSAAAGLDDTSRPAGPSLACAGASSTQTRMQLATAVAHNVLIGIDAADIGEVIPMPAIERLGFSPKVGVCRWRGRHIPVVDIGDAFGTARQAEPGRLLAVVTHGGLALGLAIHEVSSLQFLDVDESSTSSLSNLHPALRGVATNDSGTAVHVLDTATLMAMYPETGISRIEDLAAQQTLQAARPNDCAFIVFDAQRPLAVPIASLEEVLTVSREIALHETQAGRIGTMHWRGSTIEVHDLRRDEGNSLDGQVMVARHDERTVALVVDSIRALIPPNTASIMRVTLAGSEPFDMITTGRGSDEISFRVCSLQELWPAQDDARDRAQERV